MKHRNSHLLVGYWSRLRRGRAVPDQSDIDPRAIKRILSYVFILDASDSARPFYRLAGTSLCERFGGELKATNFLAHFDPKSRGAVASLIAQSLVQRQPVCLSSIASTAENGMVQMETVLAPISFGPGAPGRFIGMVQVLTDAGALCGRPIAVERLTGSQLVDEDEPLSTIDLPPPSSGALGGHSRAPHLRLVVNRDKAPSREKAAHTLHFDGIRDMLDVFGSGISVG